MTLQGPDQPPTPIAPARASRMLTAAEFHRLADVPPAVEWFANIANRHTRRAYETAVKDFMRFVGIRRPEEFRIVTRAHIIAWRDELAQRGLGGSTVRHRLASLASLFEYLCNKNAVTHNPVKGVERPKTESGEGKTPAIADHQARTLLEAPQGDDIRDKRDRAILSTLLFHALRREELCKLKVKDFRYVRKGVPHLKVTGKGGKTRYLPLHAGTNGLINDYLRAAGHGADAGALFLPLRNNRTGRLDRAITPDGVYKLVRAYSGRLGFEIGAHALRATAATNALDHQADIAKVQEWLGHANIATTRIYDHRRTRPEESPAFKVAY
jgi:integrase/recombinase XerD